MSEEREKEEKKLIRKERAIIITVGILCGLIFAAGLFYASRHMVNEVYNLAYDNGYYFDRTPTTQMIPNRPEGYIPYYNTGNNDFQNGRYEAARDNYLRALEEQPPHPTDEEHLNGEAEDIECKIRINLALSILNMIDFENLYLNDREAVDKAAEQLLIARSVLTAEDCAHFSDANGHDADAEQLKKEIDELLERMNRKPPEEEEQQQGGGGDEEPKQPSDGEGEEDQQSAREKELEDKLKEEMSKAKERQMQAERDRERERRAAAGGGGIGSADPKGQSW
ncbi:MAG: hypothetical protein IJP92_05800 [Lachnospiraceae bacterium]|nr:hypothetical protein [Lachnospiraceae bacterium]